MTHPNKLPITATNRAIAVEHLTHHLRAASYTGETVMDMQAARWIAEKLIDGPAYSVQHAQRSDRISISFNPPEVGQQLPVAQPVRIETVDGISTFVEPTSEGDGSPDDVAATGFEPAPEG